MGAAETASSRSLIAALLGRLDEFGWREGRNLIMQVQWWHDQPEQMGAWVGELVARSPDVVVTYTNLALDMLKPIAGNVPIVFASAYREIDNHVYDRVRHFLVSRHKVQGRGTQRFSHDTVFGKTRRAAPQTRAHWAAVVCLTVKLVGKPDAGNRPVRFVSAIRSAAASLQVLLVLAAILPVLPAMSRRSRQVG